MTSGSWSSSTISHIFCSVEIQHHSVAFDVQVQNIDTTLRIYEQGYQVKSSDQLGILEEQSLSKALNFAKVFVCMFFESLVKSGTITVINKIRLSTSMRPRGPIDVHFPKCIYKFRVAIVSQTCVNLTVYADVVQTEPYGLVHVRFLHYICPLRYMYVLLGCTN